MTEMDEGYDDFPGDVDPDALLEMEEGWAREEEEAQAQSSGAGQARARVLDFKT
jgi:hypothetical protein